MRDRRALLVVDVQKDFCPGGALAVENGDAVVPVINRMMPEYDLVIATQDWHPPDHISFARVHGGEPFTTISVDGTDLDLWPVHCVAGTPGADFHPGLDTSHIHLIVRKGERSDVEVYSGFADPGLPPYVRAQGVGAIDVVGLAFDFCVQSSARDANDAGFAVRVRREATRSVFPERAERLADTLRAVGIDID